MQAPDILAAATSALTDRAATRDDGRERSMKLAVGIWSAMTGLPMDELDGWRFMLALKLARAARGQCSTDDWIDLAGYAALAGECQSEGYPTGTLAVGQPEWKPPLNADEVTAQILRELATDGGD